MIDRNNQEQSGGAEMSDAGAAFAALALILGGVVDHFVTESFFLSLVAGTSFSGWNPLTAFLGEKSVESMTLQDGRAAFRVIGVLLPPGCTPSATDVLLVFGLSTAAPEVYVRQGIKVKNGITPRNTCPETIEGEPWMRFS